MNALSRLQQAYDGLPHRRRQFINLGIVVVTGICSLWFVFSLGETPAATGPEKKAAKAAPTNLSIQAPGEIDPREAWIGTAGREVARLKADVEAQQQKENTRRATEDALMKRLSELEQRAISGQETASTQAPPSTPAPTVGQPSGYPPSSPLAMPGVSPANAATPPADGMREQGIAESEAEAPIIRISLAPGASKGGQRGGPPEAAAGTERGERDAASATYLPVSFTSGVLLGGIDAPTGGQAQSNPLPIMVRLTDNAVLPNRYRAQVRECFVVASGYGDISSERVYARTVTLSCVRHDGTTLEMPIQGNLYGEDGKLGLRGRLVTKQGQLLANALRAGIVGGIGQGFAQSGTTYTTSPFGTMATHSGGTGEQIQRGMAGGVGRALDNLANYYIRLAEQTFPVIEVDAGRLTEVAITKGSAMPASGGQVDAPDDGEVHDEQD